VATLRILAIFAPAVSAYSLQGHFCTLKPQTHKWKYLTTKNTKAENTPQRQPENNTSKSNKVGLVHKTKTKIIITVGFNFFLGRSPRECVPKLRRAHLCNLSEIALVLCGFAVFAGTAKRGRL